MNHVCPADLAIVFLDDQETTSLGWGRCTGEDIPQSRDVDQKNGEDTRNTRDT